MIALAGCTLSHLVTFPFRATPDANAGAPPSRGLLLWLEGDDSLELDGAGRVARWNDARGRDRAAVSQLRFRGSPVTTTIATPYGPRRHTALRCAADSGRCAYWARDFRPGVPPLTLTGTPYSILAVVVRRPGPRFNNYFLMTTGTGCQNRFGGTGCTAGTVLHLGWAWDSMIRHSHYDFDVNSFVLLPAEGPVLIVAQSGPRGGMDVASLGAASAHTAFNSRPDPGPLIASNQLMVGGTPFFYPDGPDVPDWFFTGDIFALLVYDRELTLAERQQASDYLRNNYGPR
ncbi:hypothetical protein [Bradyrhizobium liaoningense]|uniref:hypothetical protein n=1 Tax=Bradyrhizobium liaoningense TaxID=43992 RepID=UPI001BA5D00C|nr:hypothetical protein [Bradyrhizobium liaoningense]MBR0716883.1 hypothetical protein [Bradyrhizobium liaoningense]